MSIESLHLIPRLEFHVPLVIMWNSHGSGANAGPVMVDQITLHGDPPARKKPEVRRVRFVVPPEGNPWRGPTPLEVQRRQQKTRADRPRRSCKPAHWPNSEAKTQFRGARKRNVSKCCWACDKAWHRASRVDAARRDVETPETPASLNDIIGFRDDATLQTMTDQCLAETLQLDAERCKDTPEGLHWLGDSGLPKAESNLKIIIKNLEENPLKPPIYRYYLKDREYMSSSVAEMHLKVLKTWRERARKVKATQPGLTLFQEYQKAVKRGKARVVGAPTENTPMPHRVPSKLTFNSFRPRKTVILASGKQIVRTCLYIYMLTCIYLY